MAEVAATVGLVVGLFWRPLGIAAAAGMTVTLVGAVVFRRCVTAGPEFWTEREMVGTGPDGAAVVLGGSAVMWTRDGRIDQSRFCPGPDPVPTGFCRVERDRTREGDA
ncbi:DoxX family protein [Streptomyces sp. NPDC012403]|uniref:DoxX family protein n=1 Tax=unclassified Streptomyces TaxID=2593676 RepID=UPI0036E1AB6D